MKLSPSRPPPSQQQLSNYDFVHYIGAVKPWNKKYFEDNRCIYAMPSEFAGSESITKRST